MSVFDPSTPAPAEPPEQPGRRLLSERQAEVMERLVTAAAQEAEERPYAEISVRSIAKRAGVAPATAYTYFSGKDHLLAEVLWRRMEALPAVEVNPDTPLETRVERTIAAMLPFAGRSTVLIDACTVALISPSPDVAHLRDRIGSLTHRRLVAAVGADVDPRVVRVLELAYSGALLTAGTGHGSFHDIPAFVADAAGLLVAGAGAAATPTRKGARR